MAQTEHWPRHHAVEASALAISSSTCMNTSGAASAPPRLCGAGVRYSPFSIRADTTGAVSRRVRSISSASPAIKGCSALARSINPKPGGLFMRFLGPFWGSWLATAAMVGYSAQRIKMENPSFRGAKRTRNLEIPGLVRSLSSGGAKAPTRWDHPGMTEHNFKQDCLISLPAVPIVNRLDPVVDGLVFRMLGQHRCLAADFFPYARVAKLASKWRPRSTRRRRPRSQLFSSLRAPGSCSRTGFQCRRYALRHRHRK